MSDEIVDEVRRVRDELIERHGGIDGYFKYCQQQDRARIKRLKSPPRKQTKKVRSQTTRTAR